MTQIMRTQIRAKQQNAAICQSDSSNPNDRSIQTTLICVLCETMNYLLILIKPVLAFIFALPLPPPRTHHVMNPSPRDLQDSPEIYDEASWTDLPPQIQDAFLALGWTEESWDGLTDYPPSEYMDWDDLPPQMQEAASTIGYTQDLWDAEGGSWSELPLYMKEAATALGWDEYLWDNNGVTWSEGAVWGELPEEAQEAAVVLGYDETSWNLMDGMSDVPMSVTTSTGIAASAATTEVAATPSTDIVAVEVTIESATTTESTETSTYSTVDIESTTSTDIVAVETSTTVEVDANLEQTEAPTEKEDDSRYVFTSASCAQVISVSFQMNY